MSNGNEISRTDELIRFGVLIIVLIGIVLIVALARPLIFDYIVPVVLGDGLETSPPSAELAPIGPDVTSTDEPLVEEVDQPAAVPEEAYPAIEEEEEAVSAPAESAYPTLIEAVPEVDESADSTLEAIAEEVDDAPPTPQSVSHIVKTGDTLTSIAKQYGVTVSDILALNRLVNPNRILVGDTIIVPLP